MHEKPQVTGETLLHGGRFVQLKDLEWTDAYGQARHWESAERPGDCGAVLIVALLRPSDRVVLIRQYRPPARRPVYEFPAGLVDAGETPEAAAARELREETGYTASTMRIFPAAYTTPGLSSESVFMVCAEIDEQSPENITPRTEFDESEMIETLLIKRADLPGFYRRETATGASFDAKLAAYIIALGANGE
jgi:ADP-ribose pyrophosphatase